MFPFVLLLEGSRNPATTSPAFARTDPTHYTMPIDYSKWDRIELSDDSDIEVHPNVDKKSFIKWKQRDIHEKRHQRNVEIKTMLVQLTMYTKLNARVDRLLQDLADGELLSDESITKNLAVHFDPAERFDYDKLKAQQGDGLRKGLRDLTFDPAEIADMPPYNEMVEDLFTQIKQDHPETAHDPRLLREKLVEHRRRIDDLLLTQAIKLDELLYQKLLLISSDDYHTGFDRLFLNKDAEEDLAPAPVPAKAPAKAEPTSQEPAKASAALPKAATPAAPSAPATSAAPAAAAPETRSESAPASAEPAKSAKSDQELYDELTVFPATAEFAKIPARDLAKSAEYLIKHPSICTEHQKDSLVMTAFDLQLAGDTAGAKQVVHQSLLLQYVAQLAGERSTKDTTIRAVKLFFSKLLEDGLPAKKAFLQDVDNTTRHIVGRCEVLQQEQQADGDGEQLIQLKALDDSTTLEVNQPEPGTPAHDVFVSKLSPEMQAAVLSGSLDAVNKVFASMSVEDAEQVLGVFEECNVIGISGVLENEQDFEQLKNEYNESAQGAHPIVDEVD